MSDEFIRVWPKGLSRFLALNYPGAKSVMDAVRMQAGGHKSRPEPPAKVRELEDAGYIEAKKIIADVAKLYGSRKRNLDSKITCQLGAMPQNSIDDIRKWGAAWMKYLNELDEFEPEPDGAA